MILYKLLPKSCKSRKFIRYKYISISKAIEWAKKLGYSPQQFVELAFQGILEREGMKKYKVTLSKAA